MFTVFAATDPDSVARINASWKEEPVQRGNKLSETWFALQCGDPAATVATRERHVVVCGAVLDDEAALIRELNHECSAFSPASLVASGYRRWERSVFRRILGLFGCVVCDRTSRQLHAARDPLGLRPLYYQTHGDEISISDSLDGFAGERRHNQEFIADFLAARGWSEQTIWTDVSLIPPGTILTWANGRISFERYWDPATFEPLDGINASEAAVRFRFLLEKSLENRLDDQGRTWAQLSGGVDSSSIISVAAAMAERLGGRRLGGAVTYTDSVGTGDEPFADAVARQSQVRHEKIVDFWPWRSDGEAPPLTDGPARDYPFYARDRLVARMIRSAGGTSLMSGVGPDHYLPLTPAHVPDLVWEGNVRAAAKELVRWTVATRRSIWQTASREVVTPLLPRGIRRWRERGRTLLPEWTTVGFRKGQALGDRFAARQLNARDAERGSAYRTAIARQFRKLGASLHGWSALRQIGVKHPFLYLPLVEFCLKLPPGIRSDPFCSKTVLRNAARDVLPEAVLRRSTKGIIEPRICWSFVKEREFLAALLREPILADLGCIEPKKLLAAVDQCASGSGGDTGLLYAALSLETWLSRKSSRSVGAGWSVHKRENTHEGATSSGDRCHTERPTLQEAAAV